MIGCGRSRSSSACGRRASRGLRSVNGRARAGYTEPHQTDQAGSSAALGSNAPAPRASLCATPASFLVEWATDEHMMARAARRCITWPDLGVIFASVPPPRPKRVQLTVVEKRRQTLKGPVVQAYGKDPALVLRRGCFPVPATLR